VKDKYGLSWQIVPTAMNVGEGNARAVGGGHTGVPDDEEIRHSATARRLRRRLARRIITLKPTCVPWWPENPRAIELKLNEKLTEVSQRVPGDGSKSVLCRSMCSPCSSSVQKLVSANAAIDVPLAQEIAVHDS
jgi:hypothetical protein